MPFSGLMTQECWRLINNACWCETALKLTHLPSGSSEWPQPQPLVVSHSTLLSLVRSSPSFITAFPIPHHHPSHSPSSPSPFSIIVLPILHCYPLHPPSSSFPSSVIFSTLHHYPCGGWLCQIPTSPTSQHRGSQAASQAPLCT